MTIRHSVLLRLRTAVILVIACAFLAAVVGMPEAALAAPGVGAVSGIVGYGDTGVHVGAGDVRISYIPWSATTGYGQEVQAGTTGADGGYTIFGILPGQYVFHLVDARGRGYQDSYVGNTSASAFKLDHPDVSVVASDVSSVNATAYLGKYQSVAGHVAFEGGRSAKSGEVHVEAQYRRTDSPSWVSTGTADTDAAGDYAINTILQQVNGAVSIVDYRVIATPTDTASRYLPDQYQWYSLSSPHDIVLNYGSVVSGHVDLTSSGHPAGAGQVTASLTASGFVYKTASTNAQGDFQFTGVTSGQYNVSFDTPAGTHERLFVPVSVNMADVTMPPAVMTPLVTISGNVTQVGGGPLAGIEVTAIAYDAGGNYVYTRVATTNASGDYSLVSLSRYEYEVYFRDPTGAVATMEWNNSSPYYEPDYLDGTLGAQFTHVDAALPAAGHISGHVSGPSAADFAAGNASVSVEVFDSGSSSWTDTGDVWPIDASGNYDIGDLPPDSYRLIFTDSNAQGTSSTTTSTITVATGQHVVGYGVTLTAPRLQLPSGPPIGSLDAATVGPSMISVSGWALDPDTYQPIAVHLYVDGVFQGQVQADQSRPDVAAAYPGYGSAHGYAVSLVGIAPGTTHTVCAYGINVGAAAVNTPLGCRTVTMHDAGGIGGIDSVTVGPGTVTVKGWALGWSSASPVTVALSGDFNAGVNWDARTTADGDRPDVAAAFPGYGAAHGFTLVATHVPAGSRYYCMNAYLPTFPVSAVFSFGRTAFNFATGNCPTVYVPPANPFGSLDAVTTSGPGAISLAGWAVDPDATTSTVVHVYVDGVFSVAVTADGDRPDVAAAFPASGAAHGYSTTLSGLAPGSHQVCTYGINQGAGTGNPQLGCRSVVVRGGNPFGYLETVRSTGLGSVALSGWAVDPDTASSIVTHVYVDGAFVEQVAASDARPDLAAAFPGYGAAHGVSATVTGLAGGTHTVCLYAINQLAGSVNTLLGCRSVTVPGGNPFGYLDSVKPVGLGSIAFSGWAVDPDTASSIPVHVYVDGAFVEQLTATDARPDLAAAFPGYGAAHGVSATLTHLPGGFHTVCLYAINQLSGTVNTLLGCQRVGLPGGNPFGSVDLVTTTAGSISVAGWAIDPDTAATVSVHLYVDGTFKGAFDAAATRADVAAAFVGYGAAHGYTFSVPATAGSHTACVYAINQGTGTSNPLLGCRTITVTP